MTKRDNGEGWGKKMGLNCVTSFMDNPSVDSSLLNEGANP